jgi:uncharacterized UPF0160 family protein
MAITIGDVTYTRGVTHPGTFHADDVCATALLRLVDPDFPVLRYETSPDQEPGDVLVFDEGYGKFDHHQMDAEVRDDGIPYSSFGLLWRELGGRVCSSKEAAEQFERLVVEPVDWQDNTGEHSTLAGVVIAKQTIADDMDKGFDAAVAMMTSALACATKSPALELSPNEMLNDEFAQETTERAFKLVNDAIERRENAGEELHQTAETTLVEDLIDPSDMSLSFVLATLEADNANNPRVAETFVDQLLADRHEKFEQLDAARQRIFEQIARQNYPDVLVLEQWEPGWDSICRNNEISFAAFPSQRGGWMVQGVHSHNRGNDLICPVPQNWCGKSGAELEAASGIEGATFCHKDGFMIACEDKESALAAANRMLEIAREPRLAPYVPQQEDEQQASFSL